MSSDIKGTDLPPANILISLESKDVNAREFNFSIREYKFPGSRQELELYWYHKVTPMTPKLIKVATYYQHRPAACIGLLLARILPNYT